MENYEKDEEGKDKGGKDGEAEEEKQVEVDSYKVESISTMLDDFDNVIGKNFCVYSHYEDFSFASSRSQDKLAEQYSAFSTSNFSGAF